MLSLNDRDMFYALLLLMTRILMFCTGLCPRLNSKMVLQMLNLNQAK